MGRFEELNKEIGGIVTLTQAGIISIERGVEELNKILKKEGLELFTIEKFKQRFIPKPRIQLTPEQIEQMKQRAKEKMKQEKE